MALPSSRIKLPDRLASYDIDPKWMAYKPKFVMFAPAGPHNLMGGVQGSPVSASLVPSQFVTSAGKAFSSDGTNNTGFTYDREAGNVGSRHTVFMVVQSSTSPTAGTTIIGNGRSSGTNKPFNYRLLIDPGVTRGIRYTHDTGPTTVTHDFDLVAMKDSEPSTVSFSVNNLTFHKQVDGVVGTTTLGTAPADTGEGSFRLFMIEGSSASWNGRIHLAVVFEEFIPNEILYDLHAKPQSLFRIRPSRSGFVSAAGAFTLTADSGAYNYTGTDAELDAGLVLAALTGAYNYTGTNADLNLGFKLTADSGAYTYTGTDATLTFTPAGAFTLTADSGAYTYSGTAASIEFGAEVAADSGAYTYSGTAATLTRNYPLAADSGSYTYSGTTVSLDLGASLSANSGSYLYSGTSITLTSSGQTWVVQANDSSTWTVQSNDSSTWTVQ